MVLGVVGRLRLVVHSVLDCGLQSVLLLVVEHLVALNVAQIAHVAHISECVIVIETSLACPITNSFLV